MKALLCYMCQRKARPLTAVRDGMVYEHAQEAD